MKEEKILSIVIPTYNMEKYLNRCLDSLIIDHVLMPEIEVIIVNDGSKDRSLAIAQQYEKEYPTTFRVVDKENGNYGSCVNRGLAMAKGKYFRLLDADDWFNTGDLIKFVEILKSVTVDVICTNYTLKYSNKPSVIVSPIDIVYNKIYGIDQLILGKENGNVFCMHSLTFRLDLLKQVGLRHQEGISYTDIEYCYFPLTKANSVIFIECNLYQYFLGRDGQTVSPQSYVKNKEHLRLVTERIIKDYMSHKDLSDKRKLILKNLISFPLYRLYLINLIYIKPEISFVEIDRIVNLNEELESIVLSYTFRKIPFVLLWRKFGIRSSVLRLFA